MRCSGSQICFGSHIPIIKVNLIAPPLNTVNILSIIISHILVKCLHVAPQNLETAGLQNSFGHSGVLVNKYMYAVKSYFTKINFFFTSP